MDRPVTNANIAEYLDEVAEIYEKSASLALRKTSVIYGNAADIAAETRHRLSEMSQDELMKITGIGKAIALAIYNFSNGLQEPDAIKKAREGTKYTAGPNGKLADYILQASKDAQSKKASDAFKSASNVIRGHPKEITSAGQAEKLPGVGVITGRLVEDFLRENRESPLPRRESPLPVSRILPVPGIKEETIKIIQESGKSTVLEALTLDIDRIDRHLIYWRNDLNERIIGEDLDDIARVFKVITGRPPITEVDDEGTTVLVTLTEGTVEDAIYLLSPFIRKIIYEEKGDVTALFQVSSNLPVRLVRVREDTY